MCTTSGSEVGGGWGGSTGADVGASLSGGGVGEPGVGLAGGGLTASGARPVDSERDFLRAVFFFFFAMTAVLQEIPVQFGGRRRGEGFKFDRKYYLSLNNNDGSLCFEEIHAYLCKSMCIKYIYSIKETNICRKG